MNLNVANCPSCGRLFARGAKDICPACIQEIEKQFEACAKFLRENKGTNINELSEETGVPVRQISKFIREGRLDLRNAPNMTYPCEICGTEIRSGHLCEECRGKMSRDYKHLTEDEARRREQERRARGAGYQIKE
jgi:flagellar operon protein (TIGR03826 family)